MMIAAAGEIGTPRRVTHRFGIEDPFIEPKIWPDAEKHPPRLSRQPG
jgi:hypothetical protein